MSCTAFASPSLSSIGAYGCSVGGRFGRKRTANRSWKLQDGSVWGGEIYKFHNTSDELRPSRSLPAIGLKSAAGTFPTLEKSSSSPAVVRHKRGGHLQVTRPLSLEHIGRSIYRDTALMQGQVKGVVDLGSMPTSPKELEDSLADCSINSKHRETPCGERLFPQVRRTRRWQALLDARKDGNLEKLRAALKAASVDVELCSMPVVHETREIVHQAAAYSNKCQEALKNSKNLLFQLNQLQIAIHGAEQLPLGPRLWDDEWMAAAKEKVATHEIITVARSKAMREEAVASGGSILDLEDAIQASRCVGTDEAELEDANNALAEKRREAGLPEVQSIYFTEKANTGALDGLLFRRLCFHGENRCVHALIFNVVHKDWVNIARAHAYFGIRVYIHKVGDEQRMPQLEPILKNPSKTTLWIISSNGKVRDKHPSPFTKEHVEAIAQFYYDGGGLALWAAWDPWVHEANLVLDELDIGPMSGKFVGDEQIMTAPADSPARSGFNAQHPTCHGIRKLYCGAEESSRISESVLQRGWTEILRSKQNSYTVVKMSPCQTKEVTTITKLKGGRGALLAVLLEPSDNFGPLLVHSRQSMLYDVDDTAGVMAFLQQLGAYLVLRPRDVTGRTHNVTARDTGTIQHRRLSVMRGSVEVEVTETEIEPEEEEEKKTNKK